MGQTPVYQLPYPELTEPADVPTDMRQLAEDFENKVAIPLDGRMDAIEAGVGSMAKLAHVQLGADTAQIDFTAIPQTYDHLLLFASLRVTLAGAVVVFGMRINGSVASYYSNFVRGNNNVVSAAAQLNVAQADVAIIPGATASPNSFGRAAVFLPGYSRPGALPTFVSMSHALSAGDAAGVWTHINGGSLGVAGAVNRLTLVSHIGGSIAAGSLATLYGLKGA